VTEDDDLLSSRCCLERALTERVEGCLRISSACSLLVGCSSVRILWWNSYGGATADWSWLLSMHSRWNSYLPHSGMEIPVTWYQIVSRGPRDQPTRTLRGVFKTPSPSTNPDAAQIPPDMGLTVCSSNRFALLVRCIRVRRSLSSHDPAPCHILEKC